MFILEWNILKSVCYIGKRVSVAVLFSFSIHRPLLIHLYGCKSTET